MVAFNAVHNFTWQLPQHELDARGLPQHPDFDAETAEYVDWYDGAIEPNLENGREYYLAQLEIMRSEEHTSELQSRGHLVCRLLLEKKKQKTKQRTRSN